MRLATARRLDEDRSESYAALALSSLVRATSPDAIPVTSPDAGLGSARPRESERLAGLYAEAATHGARFAALVGTAGAAETRLLTALQSQIRLDGGVVLEGRCLPGRPFAPFAEIAEGALRFLTEVGREPADLLEGLRCSSGCHALWFQHVSSALPRAVERVARDAAEDRDRFFDAIRQLLVQVSAIRPPLVVLRHVDSMDAGSLDLLAYLLGGPDPTRSPLDETPSLHALFAGAMRGAESSAVIAHGPAMRVLLDHPATVVLEIGALDAAGLRAYLTHPDRIARLLERTGGLPDAVDMLIEGDPVTPDTRLERLLSSLAPQARAVVEALAVYSGPAELNALEHIADVALDGASRNGLVSSALINRTVHDGRLILDFARAEDRGRVRDRLPPYRTRELHARAIDVAASQPGGDVAAIDHALAAGLVNRAVELGLEAARGLAARHAHTDAIEMLERVATAASWRVPIPVHQLLSELHRAAGNYETALRHAQTALESAEQDAEAMRPVAELLVLAGRHAAALDVLSRALALCATPGSRAAVAAEIAELHYQTGRFEDAESTGAEAEAAARESGLRLLELQARNTVGKALLSMRAFERAQACFAENLAHAREIGIVREEARALTNLGITAMRLDDLEGSAQSFRSAFDVASRANDTREVAIAAENLAVVAHIQRDCATALRFYHRSVELFKRLGNRGMLARVANNLGELYLWLGDTARAHALASLADRVGHSSAPPNVTAATKLLLGQTARLDGKTTEARALLGPARQSLAGLGDSRTLDADLELAELDLHEGHVDAAQARLIALGAPRTRREEVRLAWTRIAVARALGDDVECSAERALELARACGDEEAVARGLFELARARWEHGAEADAQRALDEAAELLSRLSARIPEGLQSAWSKRSLCVEVRALRERIGGSAIAQGRGADEQEDQERPTQVPPPRVERLRRAFPEIVGGSPLILGLLKMIERIGASDATVLIRGESGTGKELVANALHRASPRRARPLVKVNCGALVETLLLSELFGHERGAFTGAHARHKGRFEIAEGGTIFLDEIGDISAKTQAALLRVLQEREFERVGGSQKIRADVRVIAATHRDIERMVAEGSFREDLYYRLRGIVLEAPALRARIEDLPELAAALLVRIALDRGEAPKTLGADALELLRKHRWPGNVRELENVLRSATLFADTEVLSAADLSSAGTLATPSTESDARATTPMATNAVEDVAYSAIRSGGRSLFALKKEVERECIVRALRDSDGNITQAAVVLGMKRPRLSQLIKEYELHELTGYHQKQGGHA